MTRMSFFEKIDFARGCGLNAVELHPYKEWPADAAPLLELPPDQRARIHDACAGLDAVSVHALMGETFASDDPALREEARRGDHLAIEEAAFLGARAVVVHCRMRAIDQRSVLDRVLPVLTELAEHARDRGVNVCLETPTDLRRPEHFLALFERVQHPNLGAVIDTGHLLACLDEETRRSPRVADAYNELLFNLTREPLRMGKLYHVHLNDIRADTLADHYGIGLGFVDFPRIIGEMKRAGYAGLLAMEIHRGPSGEVGGLSPEGFRDAASYVRRVCESA